MNKPENRTTARYLVFDIETVADGRLIQRINYPDQPDLSPSQAVSLYRKELLEKTDGRSDFIPYTFHLPVSVAIARVGEDLSLIDVVTLDRPHFRPQIIARHFWEGWKRNYLSAQQAGSKLDLVTFNGRTFDIPVMELAAFRFGIELPEWFTTDGPNYKWPRYRYNFSAHIDLMEVLGNFGTSFMTGGLNLCAALLNKPGKMETKGSMVQDLWEEGQKERIDNYCICDALDTYFVFLRTSVLTGRISLEREHQLVAHAHQWITASASDNPALAHYLEHFDFWQQPQDDTDVFGK